MKSLIYVLLAICVIITSFVSEVSADREAHKAILGKKYFSLVGKYSDCILKPMPGVTIHLVVSTEMVGSAMGDNLHSIRVFLLLINDGEYEFISKSPCDDPVIQLK